MGDSCRSLGCASGRYGDSCRSLACASRQRRTYRGLVWGHRPPEVESVGSRSMPRSRTATSPPSFLGFVSSKWSWVLPGERERAALRMRHVRQSRCSRWLNRALRMSHTPGRCVKVHLECVMVHGCCDRPDAAGWVGLREDPSLALPARGGRSAGWYGDAARSPSDGPASAAFVIRPTRRRMTHCLRQGAGLRMRHVRRGAL